MTHLTKWHLHAFAIGMDMTIVDLNNGYAVVLGNVTECYQILPDDT